MKLPWRTRDFVEPHAPSNPEGGEPAFDRTPEVQAFATTKQRRTRPSFFPFYQSINTGSGFARRCGFLVSRLTLNEAKILFSGDGKSDSDVQHGIIIVNNWTCFLAFSLGRPYAGIISGNLGGGYLHSERRATCFNCILVTSFLRAYRSEHLDEFGFYQEPCMSSSLY